MSYLLTRNHIVKIIRNHRKTTDGFYWCPTVHRLLLLNGGIKDEIYYFRREVFEKKLYYSEFDIELFMETEERVLDLNEYYRKAEKFYLTNIELINHNVYDKVGTNEFTVGELIDTYEFVE